MSLFGKKLNQNNDATSPVTFIDKNQGYSPVTFVDQTINGPERFVINRFTEGGAYIRGQYLYFKMNDVEIYTSLNNQIMVDTIAKSFFVLPDEVQKVEGNVNPVDPETRQYIVLYIDFGAEDESYRWEIYHGRTSAIESLKINAAVIDIDKSLVITENVAFKDALSVRKFFKYLQNADIISAEEDFNIDDYSGSNDYNEDEI